LRCSVVHHLDHRFVLHAAVGADHHRRAARRVARLGLLHGGGHRAGAQAGGLVTHLEVERLVLADHDLKHLVGLLAGLADAGQVDHAGRDQRGRDHEDDQQHQHHVDERDHVDLVDGAAAPAAGGDGWHDAACL
jgi:hypothetical protein